jgi:predicted transcriptional regulator
VHKWQDIKGRRLTPERMAELDREIAAKSAAIDLTRFREALGVTQVELAKAIESTQGEVSRIESREDMKLSTLRRYIEALGGKLEVTAVVHGRRVQLATEASSRAETAQKT